MSFDGQLMYLKKVNATGYDAFPLEWIEFNSYKIAPSQRLDSSDSKRSTTGYMHRVVLEHEPSKAEFNLIAMNDTGITAFNTFMSNHYTVRKKREFVMKYWNVEIGDYSEGSFYMPNPQYQITRRDKNNVIYYEKTRIAFIEN